MSTQYPPSPWSIRHNRNLGTVIDKNGEEVCFVAHGMTIKESDAASRLIAAAPELLAALETVIACGSPVALSLYDGDGIDGWGWYHPDGREWAEVGDHSNPAPPHPIIAETIANATGA